jgi:hypothetical protein
MIHSIVADSGYILTKRVVVGSINKDDARELGIEFGRHCRIYLFALRRSRYTKRLRA